MRRGIFAQQSPAEKNLTYLHVIGYMMRQDRQDLRL